MNILVTGGAGFIGSHLVRRLLHDGHDVRVIDNLSTGSRANLTEVLADIEFVEGDLRDAGSVRRAVDGREIVFHEAALPSVPRSVKDPMNSIENNVIGTVELLRQAVAAGVRRVVYAGSSSAYGNQMVKEKGEGLLPEVLSPYAASKLSAEFILQSFGECYGLETVTTRYFNVFGERQDPSSQYSGVIAKFSCAMLRGESPVIFGDGHQSRDFTYVKNVVDGNILAADAAAERVSGHVFNIANGGNVSLLELVGELNGLLGSNLPICFSDARTGDVRHSTADIKKAMAMLGYIPSTDFRDGLKATVEWYRNMGKQKQPALVGQSRIA